MKILIRGAFIFIGITLLVITVLDMSTSNVRKTETSNLANNAAYQSVKIMANGSYSINNIDELVTEAVKDIVMNKETDSDIKIQVLGVDAENGMIDLNVIQTIKHLNGKETTTSERRTVILEKKDMQNY